MPLLLRFRGHLSQVEARRECRMLLANRISIIKVIHCGRSEVLFSTYMLVALFLENRIEQLSLITNSNIQLIKQPLFRITLAVCNLNGHHYHTR